MARTSVLKLIVNAAGAVASVERLNSALQKLSATARNVNSQLQNLIPGRQIAAAANTASTAIQRLISLTGGGLNSALQRVGSGFTKAASFIGGTFLNSLKSVANFIKNTMVEALRTMVRNAMRSMGLFAASLVHVQVEMDKFHSIMTLSTGSAKESQRVFDDLAATANTFGLTLEGNLLKEFNKFRTVMVQAGVEGQRFMEIFGNFAQVSNVFHLGAQDLQFAILALTQMVSKGKVSMEEMRRQLAERLPGTMQVAARAFNTTTRELELAITKGFVDPVILIEGMMQEFADTTADASLKAVNSMEARLGRLSNAFFELKRKVLASGVQEVFVNFFERIQYLLGYLIDSGAVEKFSRMLSDMANKLINFLSNTSGLKTWLTHFADNWGSIMMGWMLKLLDTFYTGFMKIAEDVKNNLSVTFKTVEQPLGRQRFAGGPLDDILDAYDAVTEAYKNRVPLVEAIKGEATQTGLGIVVDIAGESTSNFKEWMQQTQAIADQNRILLKMAWEAPADQFKPVENILRRASQIGEYADAATLRSQVGQLQRLQSVIAQIVQTTDPLNQTPEFVDRASSIKDQADVELERITGLLNKKIEDRPTRQLSDLQVAADTDVFEKLDKDLESLSGTLSGTFVNGLMEGKLAFQDMANTIVKSMMEIVAELLIITPLMNAFRAAVSGFGGFLGASAMPPPVGVMTAPLGPSSSMMGGTQMLAARGAVLDEGREIKAFRKGGIVNPILEEFAKGGIVNKPTLFPMAKGSGLMGEAGPEAILPLTRDGSGRLGVRAQGVGGGDVKVENNINITAPEGFVAEQSQTQNETGGMDTEILFRQIESRIADRVSRRQGPMFKTLQRGGHKGVLG